MRRRTGEKDKSEKELVKRKIRQKRMADLKKREIS